jgi:hypothetical protein
LCSGNQVRTEIDDKTASYVLEHHKNFDDLRQVAAHLAGLLALVASGAKWATAEHPTLGVMRRLYDEAVDVVRRAQPPPRARRHHEELLAACAALERALLAARRSPGCSVSPEIDPILLPLREGYLRLQRASAALPGFELVSFDHGCCSTGRAGGLLEHVGQAGSACGQSEAPEGSGAERRRRARASGGGVPASIGK